MAPAPKPPGARVRRNTNQPTWKHLAAAPPATPPPPPEHWSDATKEWWRVIWRSPMAALWIESDIPNLIEIGDLIELPRKGAQIVAEIRQRKEQYGLTPNARKSLMWDVPPLGEAEEEKPETPVRRLRAV